MRFYCKGCILRKYSCDETEWKGRNSICQDYEEKISYNDNIKQKIMIDLKHALGHANDFDTDSTTHWLHSSCPQLNRTKNQYSSLPRNYVYNGLRSPMMTSHRATSTTVRPRPDKKDQIMKTLVLCQRCAAWRKRNLCCEHSFEAGELGFTRRYPEQNIKQSSHVKFHLQELPDISLTEAALTTPRVQCKNCRFNGQPVVWWVSCPRLAQAPCSSLRSDKNRYKLESGAQHELEANNRKYISHPIPSALAATYHHPSALRISGPANIIPMQSSQLINAATPSPPPPPAAKRLYYHRSFSTLPSKECCGSFERLHSTSSPFPQKKAAAWNIGGCKRCITQQTRQEQLQQQKQCNCRDMMMPCKYERDQREKVPYVYWHHQQPTQQIGVCPDSGKQVRHGLPFENPCCKLYISNCICRKFHPLQQHNLGNKDIVPPTFPTQNNSLPRQYNHIPFYGKK